MMRSRMTFQVRLPAPDGFIGRACSAAECGQYFKVPIDTLADDFVCPYCGEPSSRNSTHTKEQLEYAKEYAAEQAFREIQKELQRTLSKAFGGASSRRYGVSFKPGRIEKRTVRPIYRERDVDTEIECAECALAFQVYGIFGYCPRCRCENLQVYDANLAIIEREVEASDHSERSLRHAYSDLVSTFDSFCSQRAMRLGGSAGTFQDPFDARRFFRDKLGIDILESIEQADMLSVRRVFHKRHVHTHASGRITERYVRKVPEDANLLGEQASLSFDELKAGALAVRTALANLVRATEARGA